MIWILLVVLTVLGGGAAIRAATSSRRKELASGGGGAPMALPSGGLAGPAVDARGDMIERGIHELRVQDVLAIDDRDFVVEGTIGYDEDGHRWTGARVADGNDARWIVTGIERTGGSSIRMLAADDATPIAGYPPEAIVIGEVRYAQTKRGTASCTLNGDLGALSELKKGRPEGHVERCRWWLYAGPGDATLLVEQWGSDFRVLAGKKVAEGTIDFMPGS